MELIKRNFSYEKLSSALSFPPLALSFKLFAFRFLLLAFGFSLFAFNSTAQNISINANGAAPDGSAILDVSDTTKGVLLPRVTTTQMASIPTPANGLLVYNTDSSSVYFYSGSSWSKINQKVTNYTPPIGTIIPFAGDTSNIPAGFLLCDGSLLDNTQYADLFNVIGNSWGGGGSSFNLPDLRGRFLRGADYGAGNDPDAAARTAINAGGNVGDTVGSYQNQEISSHSHTNDYFYANTTSAPQVNGIFANFGGDARYGHVGTQASGSSGGTETRPINGNVTYLICYSNSIFSGSLNSSLGTSLHTNGNNVGVGTTTPTATFEVNGSIGRKISTLNIGTANNVANLAIGSDVYLIRLTGPNSDMNISGIDSTFNGHTIVLFNSSPHFITLQHDKNTSDAENRFLLHGGGDLSLPFNSSISLIYSTIDNRWLGTGYY